MRRTTRIFVAVMGAWMGAAGIEHGIGEISQGNVVPEGILIQSWPDSAFFRNLSGEPAMTVVPNLLLTGILAVLFSLLFIVGSVFFAHRKRGGLILMLLTVPMLLFGGGIFPPILGFLIGAAATRLPLSPRRASVTGINRLLAEGWLWIFPACCVAWLALLPGVAVLDYFFGVDQVGVILAIMAASFSLLLLAYLSSIQRDRQVIFS